jgi:hypothetical protein
MLRPLLIWVTSLFYIFPGSSTMFHHGQGVQAWSPNPVSMLKMKSPLHRTAPIPCNDLKDPSPSADKDSHCSFALAQGATFIKSRRSFLNTAVINACLIGAAVGTHPAMSFAADGSATPATRYISGKPPQVPGQTPQDKSNLKGTRKDPDFLRSIADCRSQCQNTPGPDGLSKAKEDCLSECQDICCRTYEQCTFNIVPRL